MQNHKQDSQATYRHVHTSAQTHARPLRTGTKTPLFFACIHLLTKAHAERYKEVGIRSSVGTSACVCNYWKAPRQVAHLREQNAKPSGTPTSRSPAAEARSFGRAQADVGCWISKEQTPSASASSIAGVAYSHTHPYKANKPNRGCSSKPPTNFPKHIIPANATQATR